MNSKGQAMNILPLVKNRRNYQQWVCEEHCQVAQNQRLLEDYQKFLENLVMQKLRTFPEFLRRCFLEHSVDKLGHAVHCYLEQNPCQSLFCTVEMLSSHFPNVRNIKLLGNCKI